MPGRLVVRFLNCRNAKIVGHGPAAACKREQCGGQSIRLRIGQSELRHLHAGAEGPRLTDFGDDVTGQCVFHAGQEYDLRQRLASDGAEFGREVFRLLDAVDFVARGASQLDDAFSSVGNLICICRIQMNVGAIV